MELLERRISGKSTQPSGSGNLPQKGKMIMENIILDYYRECLEAEEKAEKDYFNANEKSAEKRKIYEYCFAQVMCMEELMDKLGIDWEEDDDE